MPGWLVPEDLKERWTLVLGRSQDELPPLLARLGTTDFFMHDSEHSFDCMWFEFNAAWPALRQGGVLVSDDVNSTQAFGRFAAQEGRDPVRLARGMAFLRVSSNAQGCRSSLYLSSQTVRSALAGLQAGGHAESEMQPFQRLF